MHWQSETEKLPACCCVPHRLLLTAFLTALEETCGTCTRQMRNAGAGVNAALRAGGLERFHGKGTDTKVSSHIAANHGKESA